MVRIITVAVAMLIAIGVSLLLRRRQIDVPTQASFELPVQLNRNEFASPQSPWLVVVFTSSTCDAMEQPHRPLLQQCGLSAFR